MTKSQENIEDIINYFAISLFGQNTVDEILWDLAKNCISKLEFEDCVIYLLDEERNVLVQKAAYGPKNPKDQTIFQPIEIPLGRGIVGSVAQQGSAEIIPDTTRDPRYIRDDAFRYSEISVPIKLDGKVIGVIDSEHVARSFFNERHLKILTLIASLCANKLMWAKAEEKIKKEQKALYEAQQQLTEFKLQALRIQMNPHFIFNALNAIQHFITIKETDQALRYLSVFGKFIRKILSSSTSLYIPLSDEIEVLTSYLELEKLRFEKRFEYSIDVSDMLDPHTAEVPVLLIQPFVERALTEGLLNQEKIGVVNIRFDTDDKFIQCMIKSNSLETKDQRVRHSSYRSPLQPTRWWEMQERIELLNRIHGMDIRISLIGTNIGINMPLRTVQQIRSQTL